MGKLSKGSLNYPRSLRWEAMEWSSDSSGSSDSKSRTYFIRSNSYCFEKKFGNFHQHCSPFHSGISRKVATMEPRDVL